MAKTKPVAVMHRFGSVAHIVLQRTDITSDQDVRNVQEYVTSSLKNRDTTAIVLDFGVAKRLSSTVIAHLFRLQTRLCRTSLRCLCCGVSGDKLVDAANDRFGYEVFKVLDLSHLLRLSSTAGPELVRRMAEEAGSSSHAAIAC